MNNADGEQPDETRSKINNSARVVFWMALIALGFIFEFFGRLFGQRNNPTGLWLEPAGLLTTITAATVVIVAVFQTSAAWTKTNLSALRQALLLLLLGVTMLIGSMICKSIVRTLFG
jgi:magnesium-transporting ATPase (P-type)